MFKTKNNNQKGFTLLELLVVIGIIGLLASVIVVNLTAARKKARDTKRIADVRNIQTAAESYYAKNGFYPTTIGQLTPNEIPVWPMDPLAPGGTICTGNSDNCYWYAHYPLTNPQSYHIGASFEEVDSLLFNQDRDCNSVSGLGCPYGFGYTFGFNGATDTTNVTCSGSPTPSRDCYDVAQ